MTGLIDASARASVVELNETLKLTSEELREAESAGDQVMRAIVLAVATDKLRMQVDRVMPLLMKLKGSPLGFRTDRDSKEQSKQYTVAEIRDVLIIGMLKGYYPFGSEINVFAGNFYATKEGVKRKIREFPGLTNLEVEIGEVTMSTTKEYAKAAARARWQLNGQPQELDCGIGNGDSMRISVRRWETSSVDESIGKVESKLLRRVYGRLTGSEFGIAAEDVQTIDGEVVKDVEPEAPKMTSSIFDDAVRNIASADTIRDADAARDFYIGPDSAAYDSLTSDQRAAIQQRYESRCTEIRGQRGQRSNKEAVA